MLSTLLRLSNHPIPFLYVKLLIEFCWFHLFCIFYIHLVSISTPTGLVQDLIILAYTCSIISLPAAWPSLIHTWHCSWSNLLKCKFNHLISLFKSLNGFSFPIGSSPKAFIWHLKHFHDLTSKLISCLCTLLPPILTWWVKLNFMELPHNSILVSHILLSLLIKSFTSSSSSQTPTHTLIFGISGTQ